jgi:hypothetical protein
MSPADHWHNARSLRTPKLTEPTNSRRLLANADRSFRLSRQWARASWSDLNAHQLESGDQQLRGLPASDPAELAELDARDHPDELSGVEDELEIEP